MADQLRCSECGAKTETTPTCGCSKPCGRIKAATAAELALGLHSDWSDVKLAEWCGVSASTVATVRKRLGSQNCDPKKRLGRNGVMQAAGQNKTRRDKVQNVVDALVRQGKPINRVKIGEEHGVGPHAVQLAHAKAKGKLEAQVEIRPEDLSMSANDKLEAAKRQHQRKLDEQFELRVQDEIRRRVKELVLPAFQEQQDDAALVISSRKGVFKEAEYNAILRCLHPDLSPTIEQKNEAFRLWHERKLVLMSEKEDPRQYKTLPTIDEFMKKSA